MTNDCLYIESAGHNKSFSNHQLYLDCHLSSLYFEPAFFLEVLNKVFTEYLEFRVDAHLVLELFKELLINLFDPKGRVAIRDVKRRVILIFLLFDEKQVVKLTHCILFVGVINKLKDF